MSTASEENILSKNTSNLSHFLSELLVLNQSTDTHDSANSTIQLLVSFNSIFATQTVDIQMQYWNTLSISYFHYAQQLASADVPTAIDFFEKALQSNQKELDILCSVLPVDQKRIMYCEGDNDYIQATIYYLRNNVSKLITLVQKSQSNPNYRIMQSFCRDLQTFHIPKYSRAY